jgi:hypothetical protein
MTAHPEHEVRELLAAIAAALSPPRPATCDGWEARRELLSNRAAWLSGYLDAGGWQQGLAHHARALRHLAAEPVPYETELATPAETSAPVPQDLAAAQASPANPYGSTGPVLIDVPAAAATGRLNDLTAEADAGLICGANSHGGWTCTEPPGHDGPHVAMSADGECEYARWPQVPAAPLNVITTDGAR